MLSKKFGLQNFDLFNKTDRTILIRSRYGGVFTVIALCVMFVMLVYEIWVYRSVELVESITVDPSTEQNFVVRFDITWHEMSCNDFNIDVVDINSNQQVVHPNAIQEIPITSQKREEQVDIECKPCYESAKQLCCSCSDVINFYVSKNIDKDPQDSEQCIEEKRRIINGRGFAGCRTKGTIRLPKVGGNFHVAPGVGGMGSMGGGHTHVLNPLTFTEELKKTKLSHTIHSLSFGLSYPGMVNPLTGAQLISDKLIRHMYYIRLVPTIYVDGLFTVATNQYSVTNHTEYIDLTSFNLQLPGVFFKYDFTPMLVMLERKKRYFSHFITRLCAIIGGTWVVLGLIYSSVQSAMDRLKKER